VDLCAGGGVWVGGGATRDGPASSRGLSICLPKQPLHVSASARASPSADTWNHSHPHPPTPRAHTPSMKSTIWPCESCTSLITDLSRSSNSPRYLAPATSAPMSSAMSARPCREAGTSPATMRCASPSATAVLPTPGSPISTGLFLVRRDRIWMHRRTSSSLQGGTGEGARRDSHACSGQHAAGGVAQTRHEHQARMLSRRQVNQQAGRGRGQTAHLPMTGSSLPSRAACVRSRPYLASASYLPSGFWSVTLQGKGGGGAGAGGCLEGRESSRGPARQLNSRSAALAVECGLSWTSPPRW
jgi:hypothetical protein